MNSEMNITNGSGFKNHEEQGNRRDQIITWIPDVPVTAQRRPFKQLDIDERLPHAGTARANIASTEDAPGGTKDGGWAETHQKQTVGPFVLQQHCDFFDQDHDGVIWPSDTYRGFRSLGFNVLLSLLAVIIIHANFSYPTSSGWLPDPFLRVYINNIHKDKHGSDSGTYDTEGRFSPQKFEDMFSKYAQGRDYMTIWNLVSLTKGQRLIMDPIGWGGALFEWLSTYIMLWPEDGKLKKEDIRRIYDGSLFYIIAERRLQR